MLRVIKALKDLRDRDEITKIRGTNVFVVRTSITIYRMGSRDVLYPNSGYVFLANENGDINEMDVEKEVVWLTSLDILNFYMERYESKGGSDGEEES